MERLVIDSEQLLQIGNQISSVAKEMEELGNQIKSFEVPDSEDFNFTTPGSAISSNVLNCAEKMTNSAKILNTVVENHTDMQNSLTFDAFVEKKEQEAAALLEASKPKQPVSAASYFAAATTAAYEAAGATTSSDPTTIAEQVLDLDENKEEPIVPVTPVEETPTEDDKEEVKDEIVSSIKYGGTMIAPALGYIYGTSEDKFDERIEATYDETTGFAKLEDDYIVKCNEELGNVGDKLLITTASGATISCVIGSTFKVDETHEDKIEFYTKNEENFELTGAMPGSDEEIVQIDNYGSIDKEKFAPKEETKENPTEEVKEEKVTEEPETIEEQTEEPIENLEEETQPQEDFPELIVGGDSNEILVSSTPQEVVVNPAPQEEKEPVYNWESVSPEIMVSGGSGEVVVVDTSASQAEETQNNNNNNINMNMAIINGLQEEEKEDN